MKKIAILTAILALAFQDAMCQDWNRFSLKGKVLKASVQDGYRRGTNEFSANGTLKSLSVETAKGCVNFKDFTATANGYKGAYDRYTATVTVKNGHITSISYTDGNYKYTGTSTYGNDGFLSKTTMTVTWTTTSAEYVKSTAKINAQDVERLHKAYMKETDPIKKAKLGEQYNAAAKKANVSTSGGYTREKKQSHSESYTRTYYNYKTDEHGNWISRSYRDHNGDEYNQTQDITYEPEFLNNYRWKKLQKQGDLDAIERFATNESTTNTYRQLAIQYWNEHILAEVIDGKKELNDNDLNNILKVAFNPIATENVKNQALTTVRNTIWDEQVVPKTDNRDYKKVAEIANKKWNGNDIFDQEYKGRIMARSNEMRNGLLDQMQQQTQKAFDEQNYANSINYAKQMLEVGGRDGYAIDIKQEAAHRIILSKEQANNVTEQDYATFLEENSSSKYVNEVINKRALLASKNIKDINDAKRVAAQPTADEETRLTVQKRVKHAEYIHYRGKFFHMGLGFDGSMGVTNSSLGGSINMRFGYFCSWVNLEVGAKYNYLVSTKGATGRDADLTGGYFDKHYLSVPIDLHIHLTHAYGHACYIGLGAELGVASLSSKFKDKTAIKEEDKSIKDKEIAAKKMHISPKFSFGFTGNGYEIELFALYDMDNAFNKDYVIPTYGPKADSKIFEKQITSDKFFDKTRFGLALKFLF